MLDSKDVHSRGNRQMTGMNLLTNTLTSKLRKSLPSDVISHDKLTTKLRPDNMDDFVHLQQHDSKNANKLRRQTEKLNRERSRIVKRRELLKKYNKWNGSSHEKTDNITSSPLRGKDFTNTSKENDRQMRHQRQETLPLPLLSSRAVLGGISTPESAICITREKKKPRKTEPFRIADDGDDLITVKKKSGLYMPQTRYTSKEMRQRSARIVSDKFSKEDINFETIQGPFDEEDADSVHHHESAKKRVTWSCPDQMPHRTENDTQSEGRVSTSHSTHSQKSCVSDSYMFRRPAFRTARSKIELIGVKWNLNKDGATPTRTANQRSKDLHPVATGLEKESTSITKTKWHVPDSSVFDPREDWAVKLHIIKHANTQIQDDDGDHERVVPRSVSVVTQCNSDMEGKVGAI